MSLPVNRYEPNAEKKKTHNRRKSSTRSLHQKLVVKNILKIFLGKKQHKKSPLKACGEKIFRKYFWEKSSCLGEISSHINLPPLSHSSSKLFMDRHLDNVYIVDTLNSSLMF